MDKMEKLNIIGMFPSALSLLLFALIGITVYAVLKKATEASSEPAAQQALLLLDDPEFIPAPPVPDDTMDALLHDICMHNLCLNMGCCPHTWTVQCQAAYEACMYAPPARPDGDGLMIPFLQELHDLCMEHLCRWHELECCTDEWSIQCQEAYRECMGSVDCEQVVCDLDPFCCDNAWDDGCQVLYLDCIFNNNNYDWE